LKAKLGLIEWHLINERLFMLYLMYRREKVKNISISHQPAKYGIQVCVKTGYRHADG
jgi:hypothetical protein